MHTIAIAAAHEEDVLKFACLDGAKDGTSCPQRGLVPEAHCVGRHGGEARDVLRCESWELLCSRNHSRKVLTGYVLGSVDANLACTVL